MQDANMKLTLAQLRISQKIKSMQNLSEGVTVVYKVCCEYSRYLKRAKQI